MKKYYFLLGIISIFVSLCSAQFVNASNGNIHEPGYGMKEYISCDERIIDISDYWENTINSSSFLNQQERNIINTFVRETKLTIRDFVDKDDECTYQEKVFFEKFFEKVFDLEGEGTIRDHVFRRFELMEQLVGLFYDAIETDFPYLFVPSFDAPTLVDTDNTSEYVCREFFHLVERFTKSNEGVPSGFYDEKIYAWRSNFLEDAEKEYKERCPDGFKEEEEVLDDNKDKKIEKKDDSPVKEVFFSDVPEGHKNYQAIEFLKNNEFIQGYSDGTFGPLKTISRAEMLKILIEALGTLPDPDIHNNCFSDVTDDWYAKYICFAKEKGWVQGYSDGTFRPGKMVNKVEALKMILKIFGITLPQEIQMLPFADIDVSAWYASYVSAAYDLELLEETGERFSPAGGATRGWFSEVVYRIFQ